MAEGGERSLKMLAAAMEKEERGRAFYAEAVDKCSNELGKQIFRTLAAEEGIHLKRVKEIYEALKAGKSWSGDWRAHTQDNEDLEKLFKERMAAQGTKITADTGDLEAVEIGLEFEQGAVKFFEQALTEAVEPLEKEFIELMIREERSHYESLADVKLFLTDPESWFSASEHHGLDGG